jgi:energy-coupling factor transporter ATP-binding protein EcfA2
MIEVRNLVYRYPGTDARALDGLTMTILDNSFVAIMGANGSGKTTLLRCFNGLLLPLSGVVSVDGLRTNDNGSAQEIRRRVGVVFQDPNLQMTSPTVEREIAFGLQNLRIPREEIHRRVAHALEVFGLGEFRTMPPSSLSGGERQRLAIASVWVMRPSHLVLDEATSLLSGISRKRVLTAALQLRSAHGISLILTTQFPNEALLADRLIVLAGGTIRFDGHPSEILGHVDELTSMGVPVPVRSRLAQLV